MRIFKKNVCVCVNLILFIDTQASLLFALDMVGHCGTSIWHASFQTSQVGWKVSKMLVKNNQSTNQLQLVNNSYHPPWQFNPHDSQVAECSKNSQSTWNHQPTTINQLTTNINQPSVTDDTWPLSRSAGLHWWARHVRHQDGLPARFPPVSWAGSWINSQFFELHKLSGSAKFSEFQAI